MNRTYRPGLVFPLALAALPGLAAQDSPRTAPWKLGVFFWHESPNDQQALVGIRRAFQSLGHPHELLVEQADSDRTEAERILREFLTRKVDLVFAMGTEAALIAKDVVQDVPVVFTAVTNPVESGIAPSWSGAGGNLAGNSNWISPETLVQAFRLAVPDLGRLGMLRSTSTGVVSAAELSEMQRHLEQPDAPPIELLAETVRGPGELEAATRRLLDAGVQAIWIPIDFDVYQNVDKVVAVTDGTGVPLLSSSLKAMQTGAVVGVLVDYPMLGERAALLAMDILERGVEPGSLPVGTMRGYQVVVDLGAARRAGYELPLSVLVLADRILDDRGGGDDRERDR